MHPLNKLPRKAEVRAKAWKKLIKKYEDSGLEVSDFCQKQEIGEKSFNKWREKLFEEKQPASFVPIEIESSTPDYYEIEHRNGFRLKIEGRLNEERVKRLLMLIGGVGC